MTSAKPLEPTRIVLIDDHGVLRDSLAMLINQDAELQVVGGAWTGQQGLALIEQHQPDLVLLDISLPDTNGLDLLKVIKDKWPDLPVLMLSMHDEVMFGLRAVRLGSCGYINKQEAVDKVIEAIHLVKSGNIYLSEHMKQLMLSRKRTKQGDNASLDRLSVLSDRELQVFDLIGRGKGTRAIAEHFDLSIRTIESHKEKIKKKLDIENSSELNHQAILWVSQLGG